MTVDPDPSGPHRPDQSFGTALARLRKQHQLSIAEVVVRTRESGPGLSDWDIRRLESGGSSPTPADIRKLTVAMGDRFGYLITAYVRDQLSKLRAEDASADGFYGPVDWVIQSTEAALQTIRSMEYLDERSYYEAMADDLDRAIRTKQRNERVSISAVNSIAISRWWKDEREIAYWHENRRARKAHVPISRIFVQDDAELVTPEADRLIEDQRRIGIEVLTLPRSRIPNLPVLREDWVLFDQPVPVLYLDYHDEAAPTRVRSAAQITDQSQIEVFRRNFQTLWACGLAYQAETNRT